MLQEDTLVTVAVLSYNSEKTIKETLDSIIRQTYQKIELIISDDHSLDNTISICEEWLKTNKSRFQRTRLITVDDNTGVTGNCNRCVAESHGEWLRLIAADDILLPNAIDSYMVFARNNPRADWIISKHHTYNNTFEESNRLKPSPEEYSLKWRTILSLPAEEQLKHMYNQNFVIGPTSMTKTAILRTIGFDEKYPSLEDYPINIKLLKNGIKCYFCDEYTMGYRRGMTNVCASNSKIFNLKYKYSRLLVQRDLCYEHYTWGRKRFEEANYKQCQIYQQLGMNNAKNPIYRYSFALINKIMRILFGVKREKY